MKNSFGVYLYIGKSNNIKNRLKQYLQASNNRTLKMLEQISSIDFFVTKNEIQAILLEAEMIKEHLPKYNVLLKDDKKYQYILINQNHKFPRICKYRGKKLVNCYGPFPSAVDKIIHTIQKAFFIRPCSDTFFSSRKAPCIEYQLQRCSGPCANKISEENYKCYLNQATLVLSGEVENIQKKLFSQMEEASLKFEYENASIYRDRIRALQNIVMLSTSFKKDYIAIYIHEDKAVIYVDSLYKSNKIAEFRYFLKEIHEKSPIELAEHFLVQFYVSFVPSKIYINFKVNINITNALEKKTNKKIDIITIQNSSNEILNNTFEKAKNYFYSKFQGRGFFYNLLFLMKNEFFLQKVPKKIEIYDNSHTFGRDPVGVVVAFTEDGFDKASYRCFRIKYSNVCDDYSMMREVLQRRFEDKELQNPDFILIDGGPGHVSVVKDILINIPYVGIAKGKNRNAGREKFYFKDGNVKEFDFSSKFLYFLQNVRDEAHRFAINFHRKLRLKKVSVSILDKIPGIGAKRKKNLLTYFNSVTEIKNASIDELLNVNRINKKVANDIVQYFFEIKK